MNINLNTFYQPLLAFKEKIFFPLTSQQKKIAIVVAIAISCIAAMHLISRYCFINGRKISNLKLRLTGNGHGNVIHWHGEIAQGKFRNGKLHGQGKRTWLSWDDREHIEEGQFQNGRLHGQGIKVAEAMWEGEFREEGEFRVGRFVGKITYLDGTIWEGECKNTHDLCGKGKRTFPDGRIEEGLFEDGKLNGKGTIIFSNGEKREGVYIKGYFWG